MLGGFLGWISLVLDPISNYGAAPIQPQGRLLPSAQQRPWQPWEHIITGVRDPPSLVIHDREGVKKWHFARDEITQDLPDEIHQCINGKSHEADEVKYMNKGNSIATILSDSVLVINRTPWKPETDKRITFALCRHKHGFHIAHSVEPLPGNLLAVATSDQRATDGIVIFNASASLPLMADPPRLQTIQGFPTVHSMVWDEQGQTLWAAGTDVAADGSDHVAANVTVMGYPRDAKTGLLREQDRKIYKLPTPPHDLVAEWGTKPTWWAGGHDLSPIPGQRKLLLSEDRGLHVLDLEKGQFTDHFENVTANYLRGFEPVDQRQGHDALGQLEELPQSDVKSVSLAPDGSFVYVQALWGQFRGNATNVVVDGHRHEIDLGSSIYRSRWFDEAFGWPRP